MIVALNYVNYAIWTIVVAYFIRDMILIPKVRKALPDWARNTVGVVDFVLDLPKILVKMALGAITGGLHRLAEIPAIKKALVVISVAWHNVAETYNKAFKKMSNRPFYGPLILDGVITGGFATTWMMFDYGQTLATRVSIGFAGLCIMALSINVICSEAKAFDPVIDGGQPPVDSYRI